MIMKILDWTVVGLALSGALLVTSPNSQIRLIAFCLWIFTNSWWMIHNLKKKDYPLAGQFCAFLALAVWGVRVTL